MTRPPDVLLHHSVRTTPWLDIDTVANEVRERIPDIRLIVSQTPAETATRIVDVDIVLTSYIDTAELESAESLDWIQALSAGVDTLPIEAIADREIRLTSAAGAHAQPIAEQVLGYMTYFERRFDLAEAMHERGVWERFTGGELAAKTLGIVGLGSIGTRVAELASTVGMTVIGSKQDPAVDVPGVERIVGPDDLEDLLLEADYVLLACPLTPQTTGLIGGDELGIMRSDAVLINIARGPVVDESALVEALTQRVIRGAALDVFTTEPLPATSPLWTLSNVLVTPHNAGASPALPGRIAAIFRQNYDAYRAEEWEGMVNVEFSGAVRNPTK